METGDFPLSGNQKGSQNIECSSFYRKGGILILWYNKIIQKTDKVIGSFTVSIQLKGANNSPWWLTNVYRPNDSKEDFFFFGKSEDLAGLCLPNWCLGGDFKFLTSLSV